MPDIDALISEGIAKAERATPGECWHPENWDQLSLMAFKQPDSPDAALIRFAALHALTLLRELRRLRDEARKWEREAGQDERHSSQATLTRERAKTLRRCAAVVLEGKSDG